ncbi:RNA-binding protein [Angomonas deanei]|uniref:RNA recognition motif. (A.k.a. RRM, RBD, or RNP domain), putative n=1 Tax=Angomonas deanei TaxID=59799 RepID=A0A7G2CR45_9TRYP|nr:RNA-binding protein [Angomonas deanei]CAD2222230.1 RNA recognition motif. (a.k.a. RRM, RBD, or RNP domain), putative [Angomonas deanei]|eukprot:EPY19392.1 RNA-binding protein [Angomonas deanei]
MTEVESRTNLLVRYLDHKVDDETLKEHFAPYGNVVTCIVQRDIHTGESRGFGFVRFELPEEAVEALAKADGSRLLTKKINVLWAKKEHDSTPAGEARRKMNKLFLRNIPMSVKENEIRRVIQDCGTITSITLHRDTTPLSDPSLQRRIAFITFGEEGAAEKSLKAIHNTCPFPSCDGIPIIGKLSEDYSQKQKMAHRRLIQSSLINEFNGHRRTRSMPGEFDLSMEGYFPSHSPVHSRTASYNSTSAEFLEHPVPRPHHSRTSSYNSTVAEGLNGLTVHVHQRSATYSNPPMVHANGMRLSYSIHTPAHSCHSDSLSNSQSSAGSRYTHNPYSLSGPIYDKA